MVIRVIEDSDEESDALSPVRPASTELRAPVGTTRFDDSESTDPVLFQEVYEKHRTTINASNNEFPTLEDPIINQRMSSSPLPSGGRPKRSKSLHISSLTSITDPTVSNRARRAKIYNIEDLTQITSPGYSKDIWDFPSSGASDAASGGFKSNNAGSTGIGKPLKTYGKNNRSKSVVAHSSNPEDWDDPVQFPSNALKRPPPDSPNTSEKAKRQKQVQATQSSDIYGVSAEKSSFDQVRNTSDESFVKIQVPRSTSDQSRQTIESPQKRIGSINTQPLPAITETPLGNKAIPENSYLTQTTEKATSSISIVPAVLTPSQKLQYPVIELSSSDFPHDSSQRSSVAEDEACQESSGRPVLHALTKPTKPRDIPPDSSPNPPRVATRAPETTAKASFSLTPLEPTSSVRRPKFRSKTTNSRSHRDSSYDELSFDSNVISLYGSKTVSTTRKKGAKPNDERIPVDDLFGSDEIGMPRELYQPRPSRRRTKSMGVVDPNGSTDLDDILSSLPRPKRKSKKASQKTQEVEESIIVVSSELDQHSDTRSNAEALSARHLDNRAETSNNTDQAIEMKNIAVTGTVEDSVEAAATAALKRGRPKKLVQENKSEVIETVVIAQENSSGPTNEDTIIAPVAAKHRGRPRKQKSITTEIMETQVAEPTELVLHNEKEQLSESVPQLRRLKSMKSLEESTTSKGDDNANHEATRTDREHTILSEYKTPSATPTKPAELLKTPTQDTTKKGPDQHSPLQRDRGVAYRVGLSKKRKIAPLLKIIRK